jgi:hypothetical protein
MVQVQPAISETLVSTKRITVSAALGFLALSCLQAAAEPQALRTGNEVFAGAPASLANPPLVDTFEVLVKFKDDHKVKEIIDAFWRDPPSARAKFDAFKQSRSDMSGAVLARVTYSNELVLIFPCKTFTRAQRVVEARDIAAKLMASPDIVYAEPNLSFQTQG